MQYFYVQYRNVLSVRILAKISPVVMPQRSVSRMQTRTQMQTMTSFPDYKIPGINKSGTMITIDGTVTEILGYPTLL